MRYNMHSFHNICKESKELGVISKIHINIDFLMSFFSIDRAIQLENSVNGWMFFNILLVDVFYKHHSKHIL